MSDVEATISKLRDFINRPRKQYLLLRDKQFWNQLCSSLDVIQDTDIALDDYVRNDFPKSEGGKYLVVYGALQSLVVQQDAVDHLVESLRLSIPSASEQLKDVRDMRIKSVGHPTKKGRGKEDKSYHFISRATMHKNGFQLISSSPGKDFEFTDVNILGLISKQRSVIKGILESVLDELKREEEKHKEKFKDEKLAVHFAGTLGYYISKVYEVIHGGNALGALGLVNLEFIEKALESFKQALEKRDLWGAYQSVGYIYDELEYPLSELKKYFQGEDNSESAGKKAYINFFFVDKKIKELEGIAKEIDEEYSKNKEDKMKRVDFEGDVWKIKNKEPIQELVSLLTSKDCLIVLRYGSPPYRVVIGVPHQAAIGEEYICERGGKRVSDENAASYALVTFTTLKENDIPCKLVIVAHSTAGDPNKELKSLYCQEIFRDSAKLLLECHGAREKRELDLELSSGKNKLSDTITFGKLLASALEQQYTLGVQRTPGVNEAEILKPGGLEEEGVLENPGTGTISLEKAEKEKIHALHIEAKPRFRKPTDKSNAVTPDGLILGKGLAQAIIKYSVK